jgi:hypothetical protein
MSWSHVSLLQGTQKRLRKEENEQQLHQDKESKADLRSTLGRDPESRQEVYRALEKHEKSSLKAFLGYYRGGVEDEKLLTIAKPLPRQSSEKGVRRYKIRHLGRQNGLQKRAKGSRERQQHRVKFQQPQCKAHGAAGV